MSRFKDSLTLDALHRPQLMAFCQFMGLAAFGPDPLLRFRINATLRRLQQDDKDILWEGVDALTDTECRAALRARGIPFTGLSPEQMRSGLSEWVQLSMNKEVPMVMMMMSNMYRFARVRRDQSEEDTQKPVKARIGISHIPTFPHLTPHIPTFPHSHISHSSHPTFPPVHRRESGSPRRRPRRRSRRRKARRQSTSARRRRRSRRCPKRRARRR